MLRVCLVMAGGLGRRFGGSHKPLARVCGKPMIVWVVEKACTVCSHVVVAVASHTRRICSLLRGFPRVECVETSGVDYVVDLSLALSMLPKPVLVLPSDVPLLPVEALREFVEYGLRSDADIVELVVEERGSRELIGVSIFHRESGREEQIVYPWSPALKDIDTVEELEHAESLCENSRR